MQLKRPLIILWLAKLILIFLAALAATRLIPYFGFMPYKEVLDNYQLPDFLNRMANFDGIHYLFIAERGYYHYEQAFFPLYPLLVRLVRPLFMGNTILAAIFLSNLALLLAMWIFLKLLELTRFKERRWWVLGFVLLFPTAFFFHVAYTESVFFLFLVASLYYLKKNRLPSAALSAALTALTRLVGIFLFVPLFMAVYERYRRRPQKFEKKEFLFALAPWIGLFSYMGYLYLTVGDPLFFINAQSAFGANRSTHIVLLPQTYFRYLKIFLTADLGFTYFVSVLEVVFFTFVFLMVCLELIREYRRRDLFLLSVAIFSLANILLPTLTGTFSSVPRYALFSVSVFFFLGNLKNRLLKAFLLAMFMALQALLFGFFVQGYFIS